MSDLNSQEVKKTREGHKSWLYVGELRKLLQNAETLVPEAICICSYSGEFFLNRLGEDGFMHEIGGIDFVDGKIWFYDS